MMPPNPVAPGRAAELAAPMAAELTRRKYDYSRANLRAFQKAAGIKPDGIYGGGTAGALAHFLGKPSPRPLFKPTKVQPYTLPPMYRTTRRAPAKPAPKPKRKPTPKPKPKAKPVPRTQVPTTGPRAAGGLPDEARQAAAAVADALEEIEARSTRAKQTKPKGSTRAKQTKPADLPAKARAAMDAAANQAVAMGGFSYEPPPILKTKTNPRWSYKVTQPDVKTLAYMLALEGRDYAQVAEVALNRFAWLNASGKRKDASLGQFLRAYSPPLRREKPRPKLTRQRRQELARGLTRALRSGPVDIPPQALHWSASYVKGRPYKPKTKNIAPVTERRKGMNMLYTLKPIPRSFEPYYVTVSQADLASAAERIQSLPDRIKQGLPKQVRDLPATDSRGGSGAGAGAALFGLLAIAKGL